MDAVKKINRFMTITQIWLAVMFICVWPTIAAGAITVEIKPTKIAYGETFNLIITSDDRDSAIPNLVPLQSDFRIIGTERTMSYTVINGQARAIHQFIVLLMPKKQGKLAIPALKLGNEQTEPQTIEVTEAEDVTNPVEQTESTADQEQLLIKTDVNSETPFINQQVIYSVKLYNSGRLLDAEYQPPKVENALLISLGDADRYQTMENGQNYVVEEQRYAIFPQKSGKVKITGPSLHGLLYDVVPRQVNIPPKTIELNVKPVPGDYKGNQWLPAKALTLSEHYDSSKKEHEQGETMTRIIDLEAVGIPAQLLPTLQFQDSNEFSVYPEKPELTNSIRQYELVGKSTIRVVYLLNKSGQVTIPEFSLTWFNTSTGKTEITKLPPRTIQVLNTKTEGADTKSQPPSQAPQTKEMSASSEASLLPKSDSNPVAWFLAIAFAVAWILTLLMWWFRPIIIRSSKKRLAIKELHEACIRNNPVKARETLLNWAALHWPEATFIDLNDIAKRVPDSKFKKQLNILSKAIYSPVSKTQWDGSELWLSIQAYRKKKSSKKSKPGDLPSINP